MVFELLFNREKISTWKDKYFNYEECKLILNQCKALKEDSEILCNELMREKNSLKKMTIVSNIEKTNEEIIAAIFFLKMLLCTQFNSVTRFFHKKCGQLVNDLEIVKNILDNRNRMDDEELDLNLNGLKILHIREFKKEEFLLIINNSLRTLFEIATWVRNFSVLNGLALDKTITKCDKCMKEYLGNSNLLSKEELETFFTTYVQMIQKYREKVVKIYARLFYNGDEDKAVRNIKSVSPLNVVHDKWVLFLISVLTIILFLFFLLVYIPSDRDDNLSLIGVFFPAFNFTLIVLLMLLFLSIDMVVLRYFRINFVYLLEIDPSIHLNSIKIFRIILSALVIWGLIFISFTFSATIFYEKMKSYLYIFTIINFLFLFSFVFWPFKSLLYKLRIYFMNLLGQFIFPFGKHTVHFKLVIFSGLMTTFSKAFVPLVMAFCIFWCPECRENNKILYCDSLYLPFLIIQISPYILRTIQAFNFAYHKRACWPYVANGFRHLSSCAVTITGFLNSMRFSVFNFFYNLFWDYCMSWQLFQKNDKHLFLREKIIYPKWFYYTVILLNIYFRSTWSFRFVILPSQRTFYIFIESFIEIIRRGLWILIRVENESINNPEKFRKFIPIPEVTEETQNINR